MTLWEWASHGALASNALHISSILQKWTFFWICHIQHKWSRATEGFREASGGLVGVVVFSNKYYFPDSDTYGLGTYCVCRHLSIYAQKIRIHTTTFSFVLLSHGCLEAFMDKVLFLQINNL